MFWQYLVLCLTLAGMVGLFIYRFWWLVPVFLVSLALEVSREWFPQIPHVPAELGLLSFARALTYAIILFAFWEIVRSGAARETLRTKLKWPLSKALIAYMLIAAGSVMISLGRGKTIVENMRLLMLFVLMIALWHFLEKAKLNYKMLWLSLAGTAVILFPLLVYQYMTGNLLFLQEHYMTGDLKRINATFVDPNILARYMIAAAVACLVLGLSAQKKSTKWFYQGAFLLIVGNIGLSMSRSGVLTFMIVMLLLVGLLGIRRVGLWLLPTLAAGTAYILLNPALAARLATLREGLGALDQQRPYLIKAGIQMFLDHPFYGIGLGGYGQEFLRNYSSYRTVEGGATLSHTTAVTIAAELGILGLIALTVIILVIFYTYWQIAKRSEFLGLYAAGAVAILAAIFISSQSEGRLFEDPMLWVFLAVLNDLRRQAETQREVGS